MEQIQIKAPQIRTFLISSVSFCQNLLGYAPRQTSLQEIPESQWGKFMKQRELNFNSSGIYLPRNQTAIIRGGNPLSLFHEYFGHGLYCEQSLLGGKLVDLEKKLMEDEGEEFQGRQFTLEDLQKFRKQNQTFQELDEFRKQNFGKYELFAIWTEYLLSGEHDLREDFEEKYNSLRQEYREIVDSVISFSNQYGNLATFYVQGMERRMTTERVAKLLKDVYKDKLQDVNFVLLYGSKKPFSDIDIFMVGHNPQELHSDWLDVKYKSRKEFEKGLRNFDVRILVPLMNGDFVFGNKSYFEKSRRWVLSQPITEEAIKHNLKWASRMQRLRDENFDNHFLRSKFDGYTQTYLANALALRQGLRLFTKKDLLSYSHSETGKEMKGGSKRNAT